LNSHRDMNNHRKSWSWIQTWYDETQQVYLN